MSCPQICILSSSFRCHVLNAYTCQKQVDCCECCCEYVYYCWVNAMYLLCEGERFDSQAFQSSCATLSELWDKFHSDVEPFHPVSWPTNTTCHTGTQRFVCFSEKDTFKNFVQLLGNRGDLDKNLSCHTLCPKKTWLHFYPRDAMLARVIAIASCPSVCLSVTRRYCVKRKKASGMISSPSGSPKTLVFWRQNSSPNSKGFPPNGGLKEG